MYKKCKDNLTDQEILLHCDFSENYACKLAEEVQALHFGASKRQISLHTGVFYAKDDDKAPTSFCTISPNTNHSPGAIWAHLAPVIQLIKDKYPKVTTLHFYSDGPTTQYRQKKNFYLINKTVSQFGFEKATWSFFEASHGKGAADGIGGATKRSLDSFVTHGRDIPDAETAYKELVNSNSKIKYFFISDEEIEMSVKTLDSTAKDLVPVPNTIAIHQVISIPNTDTIKYRKLSCFCGTTSGYCACFDVKEHHLRRQRKNNNNKRKIKENKQKNIKKRCFEKVSDTSDSESECDISYAESDKSSWKADDELLEDEYEKNGNKIEIKLREDNVEISKGIEEKRKRIEGKVTILSDIRYAPENKRYIDINSHGPLTLKRIDTNFQINNDIYKNPTPSTSDMKNKENLNEKTKINLKIDRELKECDVNEVNTAKAGIREKEMITGYDFKQDIRTEIENNDCDNNLQIETKSEEQAEIETANVTYKTDDSVLVRYYERKDHSGKFTSKLKSPVVA
ncbi:hypothetical protein MSG28_013580 [Choristoneura fumiferana]|uniref:Uncharacterized protein n=1 Tax=Choristoneura fumiferana TaxID=7141 RepID=A0ACC0K8Q0_CHOFU|nr:hypothetical protein MSG28_013580 [Choristoneura fumiferana]